MLSVHASTIATALPVPVLQANVDVTGGLKVKGEAHFVARPNPE